MDIIMNENDSVNKIIEQLESEIPTKKVKVYIDGQEGTTGLKILERFKGREDIELLTIAEALRKDKNERKKLINESDFTFLCLPDVAAKEAVSLCENPETRIIDASTAHRTNPEWVYGFPELSKAYREKISRAKRVAVPGCYASGFNALCYPLMKSGILPPFYPIACTAVSGYSGAGKKGIAMYESAEKTIEMFSPKIYALDQNHKHVKEMKYISGLSYNPMFVPVVDDYYSGMLVSIPLHTRMLTKLVDNYKIWEVMRNHYKNEHFVKVMPFMEEDVLKTGGMYANTLKGTNNMQIFVCGNSDQALLIARFDNLGKGASGAAVQCMNIMMGIDERTGLE